MCVFNLDDIVGREFYDLCNCQKYSYGIINPSDLFAINIKMDFDKSKFIVNFEDEILDVEVPLVGKFNIYNACVGFAFHFLRLE